MEGSAEARLRKRLDALFMWFIVHRHVVGVALIVASIAIAGGMLANHVHEKAAAAQRAEEERIAKIDHCISLQDQERCDCLHGLAIEYEASLGTFDDTPIRDKANECQKALDGTTVHILKKGGRAAKFLWDVVTD